VLHRIGVLLRQLQHVFDGEALDLGHRGHDHFVPLDVLLDNS
jgi:hypothetical protein